MFFGRTCFCFKIVFKKMCKERYGQQLLGALVMIMYPSQTHHPYTHAPQGPYAPDGAACESYAVPVRDRSVGSGSSGGAGCAHRCG